MPRRFQPPVEAVDHHDGTTTWEIHLPVEHRQVVVQLLAELRALLTDEPPSPLLARLFPTAYADDEEKEAEYQRLMREELVESRLTQLDLVSALLEPVDPDRLGELDEAQVVALMQSLNAIRLVLGTMLDVGEDDDEPPADADEQESHAHELYAFLSWLLEWTVRSMSD